MFEIWHQCMIGDGRWYVTIKDQPLPRELTDDIIVLTTKYELVATHLVALHNVWLGDLRRSFGLI